MSYSMMILAVGGGSLAAIALWLVLLSRNRVSEVSTRRLLGVMLGVGLACRVAFVALTPTYYAPDEQAHFNYVKYLAENRSFPVQTSRTDSPSNDWEYYQPPLYYMALAPFYLLFENIIHNEAIVVRLLRAVSVILWGVTILFAFRFLERVHVEDGFLIVFVIGMVALLPSYIFSSSVINNDNLLLAIGAATLYLAVNPKMSAPHSLLTGVLLGLGLLTKHSAGIYLVFILFVSLAGLMRRTLGRTVVLRLVLPVIVGALIGMPWALRNWRIYGSFTAEEIVNVPYPSQSLLHAVRHTARYITESFWAVSGIHNNIRSSYPIVGMHVFLFACIGLLLGLFFKRERFASFARGNFAVAAASCLAILVNLALVFRFGVLYGQGQGRFLFPMLIPLSLLLGIGLRMFSLSDSRHASVHVTGFFITYAVSFVVYSIAMFLRM